MGFTKIRRVRTYRMTFRRNGEALSKTLMLVRMYTAKERETLVIETAHSLLFGLFRCPRTFEKSVSGHRLQEDVDAEQLHADGLTIRKVADIFALVSRGRRSDRTPPRESLRRTHGTLQPVWLKVS